MRTYDRRSFLRTATRLSAATLLCPDTVLADPYRPWRRTRQGATPIRIRGRVTSSGEGLENVRVSDGVAVVLTDADGRYELVSDSMQDFVFVSTPAGHAFGRNATGTARFYRPLAPDPSGEMAVVFDLHPLRSSDDEHTLLWLPDIQPRSAWDMERFHEQSVPDVQGTVASLGDRHVVGMAGGDIVHDDLTLYPEYERGVERMGVPFFQVVGNHDLDFEGRSDEETTRTFSRHFGPRYYSFDRGAIHYIVLDDVFYYGTGYVGYLEHEQLEWLEADLATVEPGSPVVVGLHIPVASTPRFTLEGDPDDTVSLGNRDAFYRLLEPFEAHVLSGHTHENHHNRTGGVHEHVSGTVCGAWWSGPICADGTPNGYSVYDVRGEEISWRYKSTGYGADHQMRVYLPGADPSSPDELVANVWDADEGWEVVWYEDGQRKGRMARRIGFDPLSRKIHGGDALPPRRPWVDPYPRYLHYAPVSPETRELRVEATDRSGRTYSGVAAPVSDSLKAWPVGGG
ncbi:MAG: calcineurin-like phosphoesterase family protein [Longimicrobiales bacterium]|nr:calcineurin-like phosphoesterase family protein [Longimicrobiales bacterium]